MLAQIIAEYVAYLKLPGYLLETPRIILFCKMLIFLPVIYVCFNV